MADKNTYKASFRLDSNQYRVVDELLRHHNFPTMSEGFRYAVELLVAKLGADETLDPTLKKAAELFGKVRTIEFNQSIEKLETQIKAYGGKYGIE